MEEIIRTFHIDGKMILAQVVNFSIVVFVFYKFGYKLLLQKMNDRTEKIEKGIEDAKKAGEKLERAEKRAEKRLNEARKESREILERAQKQASENGQQIIAGAKEEAKEAVEKAKKAIEGEKEKMLKEVRAEIGKISIAMTEKILGEELDEKRRAELNKKTLESLGN